MDCPNQNPVTLLEKENKYKYSVLLISREDYGNLLDLLTEECEIKRSKRKSNKKNRERRVFEGKREKRVFEDIPEEAEILDFGEGSGRIKKYRETPTKYVVTETISSKEILTLLDNISKQEDIISQKTLPLIKSEIPEEPDTKYEQEIADKFGRKLQITGE